MPARMLTGMRWLALLATLLMASIAWAAGFDVISASTRLEGGVYRLNAQIQYRFSEAARDALQNGVPLTIALEMEVRRRRPWVWDETVYALDTALPAGVSHPQPAISGQKSQQRRTPGLPHPGRRFAAYGADHRLSHAR